MQPNRLCIAPLLCGIVVSLATSGCGKRPGWGFRRKAKPIPAAPAVRDDASASAGGGTGATGDDVIVVQLHFDVMRVELPIESVRHSTKIWNHVDELQVDPRRCALLARNGLRVGVAEADAWPAIQAVLQAHQANATRQQHAVQSGYPLTLKLGDVLDGETIFSYDGQGNLAGSTFGQGEKYIHLDYAVHPDDTRRITLKVTPEVHIASAQKRWTSTGGAFAEQPRYEGHLFSELAAAVTLAPGQFLVIGPSPQADIAHLLGSRFLERASGGTRYETLLLATPQLFRNPNTRGAEPPGPPKAER